MLTSRPDVAIEGELESRPDIEVIEADDESEGLILLILIIVASCFLITICVLSICLLNLQKRNELLTAEMKIAESQSQSKED